MTTSGSACCAAQASDGCATATSLFALPRDNARPFSVAVDRDGNVWYADISGFVGMLPATHAGARQPVRWI
jgi:streptogramin lyase